MKKHELHAAIPSPNAYCAESEALTRKLIDRGAITTRRELLAHLSYTPAALRRMLTSRVIKASASFGPQADDPTPFESYGLSDAVVNRLAGDVGVDASALAETTAARLEAQRSAKPEKADRELCSKLAQTIGGDAKALRAASETGGPLHVSAAQIDHAAKLLDVRPDAMREQYARQGYASDGSGGVVAPNGVA